MTTIGGFGLVVKIDVASTPTAIADLIEGEIPKFKKFIAEATSQSASGGYAQRVATGKRSLESFKVTLGWDSDAATHAAIQAGFDSEDPVDISVVSPGTDETITFTAHIEEIARIPGDEDYYKAEVVITPTGAPNIT
jgi:predicted secreted protein